jgi:hypothetical protein
MSSCVCSWAVAGSSENRGSPDLGLALQQPRGATKDMAHGHSDRAEGHQPPLLITQTRDKVRS